MDSDSDELFAVAPPGLERVVADEARGLGISGAQAVEGGAVFRGGLATVARANVWLRTASRVLRRLGAFDAPGRRELSARAARLPLDAFARSGSPLHIRASSQQSRLYHTALIAEAVLEGLGREPAAKGDEAPTLLVRLDRNRCTVSIDTSGELLHRRGWREEGGHAPLRETLAAGMLLLAGYDGGEPFLDPMCGSGTLAVEAWAIAARRAPGLERRFAFESFPSFDPAVLESIRAEAREQQRPPPATIDGSDVHAGALAAARRNAERARAEAVRFERADVATRVPTAPSGLLLANPPYGRRLQGGDEALRSLASALDGPFLSWRTGVLLPMGAEFPVRRPAWRSVRLENGGIVARLVEYRAP